MTLCDMRRSGFHFLICFLCAAMSNMIDSEAHFRARASETGLAKPVIDAVVDAGANTLSRLAFAIGQPNQPLVSEEVSSFLRGPLGREPSLQEVATLKRLTFEAQTFLIASLRQTVEQTDDSAPRKIAQAERNERMQAVRTALGGLSISGELDPAHSLLDRACAMFDKNTVAFLEPATCINRALEVQGAKQDRILSLEKGSLVLKDPADKVSSPTDTEIKLHYALVRRGIAFEFARLMSHDQHTAWSTFLFESLHREVPPGYMKPQLAQILQCDKAAWSRLASTQQQVRQANDGSYPLGVALLALRHDPHITLFLAPIAKQKHESHERDSYWRSSPYADFRASKGKGKGKGKTKKGINGKGAPPMPKELIGKYHRTAQGDPICFAFNSSSGCSEKGVTAGQRCRRGWHVCCEPKCQLPHSLQEHPK